MTENNIYDLIKHLKGQEITVRYKDETGKTKERPDIIKDIIQKEDGTFDIVFYSHIKQKEA